MLSLDVRTLSFIAMVSSVLLAVGLQLVNRTIARDPSLRLWAYGASASGVAYILFAVRGIVPDLVSIVFANTLIVIGTAWFYQGTRIFLGLKRHPAWYWTLAIAVSAFDYYFTYPMPSLSARVVVLSVATVPMLFASAFVLLRPGNDRDRLVRWFVAAGFLATAVFLTARAVLTPMMAAPGQDFMMAESPVQTLSLVFGIGLNVVMGIGLPLLISGRIHRRLQENDVQLKGILESTADGILAVDGECKILRTNQRFAEMWQIPRPLLDRGDDQALLKFVLAQLQDPEAFLGKVRALYQSDAESADNLQFKDGRVFECKSFPLILNHAVLGRVWSFSDATARIQAAEALRAGEERFRDLAIMSSDWFWEQDTEFRFIVMSEDLARKATLSPASTIGKTRWELPVEGVSEAQWNVHRAMLQNREPIEDFVYQLRNDVGELRSFSITGKPVFGPDGAFRGYRGTGRDVTVQKVEEDRIQHVAHHDSLTGLPNRLLFRDRLGQATSVAKRDSRQLALLYLDLDKFKQVNDTLGHDAGDQVLQLVAERIREQVRESDTIARLGGDEFAVIVRDILNRQDVETVAGKIAAAISAPMNLPNQPRAVEIGCSIGIAVYPVDAQDQENLIHVADAAMYETKRNASAKRRN